MFSLQTASIRIRCPYNLSNPLWCDSIWSKSTQFRMLVQSMYHEHTSQFRTPRSQLHAHNHTWLIRRAVEENDVAQFWCGAYGRHIFEFPVKTEETLRIFHSIRTPTTHTSMLQRQKLAWALSLGKQHCFQRCTVGLCAKIILNMSKDA